MAKEDAAKFLLLAVKNKNITNAYNTIIHKYDRKAVPKAAQEKALRRELIALARNNGFDFSLEDLHQIKPEELSGETLAGTGKGCGRFSEIWTDFGTRVRTTYSCIFTPDEKTLRTYYYEIPCKCQNYVFSGSRSPTHNCWTCANLKSVHKRYGADPLFEPSAAPDDQKGNT